MLARFSASLLRFELERTPVMLVGRVVSSFASFQGAQLGSEIEADKGPFGFAVGVVPGVLDNSGLVP